VEQERQMRADRASFLTLALSCYVRCLELGDAYDMEMFRLCSLWLVSANDGAVDKCIEAAIATFPSYKWLVLIYQIAARFFGFF
jgi:ataxia telangiectasia mutated family protein